MRVFAVVVVTSRSLQHPSKVVVAVKNSNRTKTRRVTHGSDPARREESIGGGFQKLIRNRCGNIAPPSRGRGIGPTAKMVRIVPVMSTVLSVLGTLTEVKCAEQLRSRARSS